MNYKTIITEIAKREKTTKENIEEETLNNLKEQLLRDIVL